MKSLLTCLDLDFTTHRTTIPLIRTERRLEGGGSITETIQLTDEQEAVRFIRSLQLELSKGEWVEGDSVTGATKCAAPPDPTYFGPSRAHDLRDDRQARAAEWVESAFGHDHAIGLPQRGIRTAEEAIELAQVCGVERVMLHKLIEHVYDRPVGEIGQEIGGLGVCILAVATAAHLSADVEEERELRRVLAKPLDHFRKRNAEKNAAGFDATAPLAFDIEGAPPQVDHASIPDPWASFERATNLARARGDALLKAAAQFDFYERSHREKGTPDADAKANVNRDMAAMCRAAAS